MNIRSLEFSPGASPEAIARFEQVLGRELPEDYRSFLREFDGAKPIQSPCIPVPNNNTDVQVIYGISEQLPDYARSYDFLDLRTEDTAMHVPVANDSGGNMFWLSLADEDFGRVYFVHHDWSPSSGLVADSWSQFVRLINEGEERQPIANGCRPFPVPAVPRFGKDRRHRTGGVCVPFWRRYLCQRHAIHSPPKDLLTPMSSTAAGIALFTFSAPARSSCFGPPLAPARKLFCRNGRCRGNYTES
jgi:hypothetical protein